MYAVFGDSYVTRLKTFTGKNLKFEGSNIKFYDRPGMSTRHKYEEQLNQLCEDRPQYVFIIIGGNDINTATTPATIAENLKTLVKEMKWCGIERVFFMSICQRGKFRDRSMTEVVYRKMKTSVNDKMRHFLKSDYVNGDMHIKYPQHFSGDGVHLNQSGLKKLKRVIFKTFKKTV